MAPELGILSQKRRDKAAAKRFFLRVLPSCPAPRKIATGRPRSYLAAKADIASPLVNVSGACVDSACPKRTRALLSGFGHSNARGEGILICS